MIPEPPGNTIARPYRGASVQEVTVPLTEADLLRFLLGREVYRRTEYLVLRNGDATAMVRVRKASEAPLFSPVVEARVLAIPGQTAWIEAPATDVGNASELAATALEHAGHGILAYVVKGRYEHVNFIWKPAFVRVRVVEVVPPEPAKLLAMAQQVVDFDEDLPPLELVLDAVDIRRLATAHQAERYLLPCRGSGVELGAPVEFLDTRPPRRGPWLLIGCERSMQLHRHFYGDEPDQVELCPLSRLETNERELTLAKCCLLERGVELRGSAAVVPWGSTRDEVRTALRWLTGVEEAQVAHASGAAGVEA
jgi:hypothetical protein